MEPVEEAGLEEPRHRDPSPLYQHPPKPASTKRLQHDTRLEALGAGIQGEDFREANLRGLGVIPRGAAHHEVR